jgi:hypothetical protein
MTNLFPPIVFETSAPGDRFGSFPPALRESTPGRQTLRFYQRGARRQRPNGFCPLRVNTVHLGQNSVHLAFWPY